MRLLCAFTWLAYVLGDQNTELQKTQTCGGSLNLSDSPVFLQLPHSHPAGFPCNWTLVSHDACSLVLDLGDLRLPPCPSASLVVGEVELCGELPRVVQVPLHSLATNVTLRTSDDHQSFNITVRQSKCDNALTDNLGSSHLENLENFSCGGEFFGDNVVIESPGYPSQYPAEAVCTYTIRRSSEEVCQVEVSFENSSLEQSQDCYKDRLEIQGTRLCGDLNGVRTYGIEDVLQIKFITDYKVSGKGFKLLARQIKCSDTPIVIDAQVENDKQDSLDCNPPGVPIYLPAGEGYPRTRRPFPPFPFPGVINYPPVQNYPPQGAFAVNTNQRPPPGGFPTRFPPRYPPFNPTGENIPQGYLPPVRPLPPYQGAFPQNPSIPFNTFPPTNQRPPTAQYPQSDQCCGRVYTDSHFLIVSPGFPRSQSSDCVYTIQRYSPSTSQIRFQFRYFWVGQDTGSGCNGGVLEIDGNRICGCKTGLIWTIQFYDSESVKVLHLRLDSSVDKLFNGFVIEVYQDDSYSGRYKRGDSAPQYTLPTGQLVNFTQYVETFVEREPLINNQLVDGSYGQLVWDSNQQAWALPTDFFCLRWNYQDWILLAKEALWSLYQCPVSASPGSVSSVDSSRFDITACRTCNYFCRQNCQCC